jgi:hypothetical protein
MVVASALPIVFNKKKTNNTHIAMRVNPNSLGIFSNFARINNRNKIMNEVSNEAISILNNCASVFILPPHKKSIGTESKNSIPTKIAI